MLIFLDTEFNDLVQSPLLISIGLVSENERTFYAELSDTYSPKECGDFTLEHVLPLLEGGGVLIPWHELAPKLKEWIASFSEPVQIAVDSLAWDWPWVLRIFNDAAWPANLDKQPALLTMNYLVNWDVFEGEVEAAFDASKVPPLRRHHALDDAKANLIGFQCSGGFE